ncbi:hypothetical protein Tco_0195981 [Tanacetum coccineum]
MAEEEALTEQQKKEKRKFQNEAQFDKLDSQIDTFVPINLEATKAKLKRYGEELQTKTSKKQRFDDKDVPIIGEKVAEIGNQKERNKIGTEDAYKTELLIEVNHMTKFDHLSMKMYKVYPTSTKDGQLENYDKCEVHCLTLEACTIYMLADRKYPLSSDAESAQNLIVWQIRRYFSKSYTDYDNSSKYEQIGLKMLDYRGALDDLRLMFDPPLQIKIYMEHTNFNKSWKDD